MTLQRYTDTIMTSHYSDIHVSIPPDNPSPDPYFDIFTMCEIPSQLIKDKDLKSFKLLKLFWSALRSV